MSDKNLIAQTILNQLGGHRFTVMTGAKEYVALPNGLRFKIGRNQTATNMVCVEYDAKQDLYNLIFENVSVSRKTFDVTRKLIEKIDGVDAKDLQNVFTKVTGLATSL